MHLRSMAIDIINTVLKNVYRDSRNTVEKKVEDKLRELLEAVAPEIVEKEKELQKLQAALGYTYNPTAAEYIEFDEHVQATFHAGGTPPDENEYWANVALDQFEAAEDKE